ncbi:uncharacterized protein LOC129768534 [Toxorhynchites rutilus septentrionalis]|uniref:uncharacterized protein LOC129768534 n=1 Tax=Toxorhynchites rutilus septentrionalis TaxID=329112 RepID=UPI002478BCD0|nr:uncharacterized protein LOC129768534 [Toxorhynchites rutilus septentrionalis]
MFHRRNLNVLIVSMILIHQQLAQGRPQEKSVTSNSEVGSRRANELTRETKIGDSKVFGLLHNESENKEAKLEKEDLTSKIYSFYDNIQQKIIDALNPGAVVDKATPKDYKPNPIEDYQAFREGIIKVVDALTKQLNAAIEAPKELFNKAKKGLTKSVNEIGSKLVGLE